MHIASTFCACNLYRMQSTKVLQLTTPHCSPELKIESLLITHIWQDWDYQLNAACAEALTLLVPSKWPSKSEQ